MWSSAVNSSKFLSILEPLGGLAEALASNRGQLHKSFSTPEPFSASLKVSTGQQLHDLG